ncbi:MAG: hypothetical protein ACYS1A_16620 [Planctomycetota bacterium]|jgi:hypothetical protein
MDLTVGKVNSQLGKYEFPIGALGFIYGVTSEDIDVAIEQGVWNNRNAEGKARYIIHNLLSRTTGYSPFEQEEGVGPGFTINPAGFMNRGLAIAIGAYLYKEFGLPYANTVEKLLKPLGTGMAIGGIFDPPVVGVSGGTQARANNQTDQAQRTQRTSRTPVTNQFWRS